MATVAQVGRPAAGAYPLPQLRCLQHAAISTAFLGWCLVVAGVAQGIFALSSETPGNFFLKLLVGVLYVVSGLALAVFPPLGLDIATGQMQNGGANQTVVRAEAK